MSQSEHEIEADHAPEGKAFLASTARTDPAVAWWMRFLVDAVFGGDASAVSEDADARGRVFYIDAARTLTQLDEVLRDLVRDVLNDEIIDSVGQAPLSIDGTLIDPSGVAYATDDEGRAARLDFMIEMVGALAWGYRLERLDAQALEMRVRALEPARQHELADAVFAQLVRERETIANRYARYMRWTLCAVRPERFTALTTWTVSSPLEAAGGVDEATELAGAQIGDMRRALACAQLLQMVSPPSAKRAREDDPQDQPGAKRPRA